MNISTNRIPFLLLIFVIGFGLSAKAQSDNENAQYFDESGFKHKLWYGGGFNLGFSGNQNLSLFSLGISPMVGYKIIDQVSVGPRLSFQYNHIKGIATDGRVRKVQPVSFSYGAFARWKFLPMIFAHVEYEIANTAGVYTNSQGFLLYDINSGEIQTYRELRHNMYIGAGYNSGFGNFGYELLLLYNALTPENSLELPFSIRFGLTYNF
ncbi:MAG: hypothetical protein GYB31_19410 [Bacteroidetes bacterium]|nr:hypothetical protein [Bacteroidota bacterium]